MNGDNFYSLGFPEKVDFPPSALIGKIISGRKPFRLILQREGTSPVQIVIASEYELDTLLRYAVANKDYNCTVTRMDVLRSSGYVTGLSLKNVAIASFLRVSETIASTLLALNENEKFRVVIYVLPLKSFKSTRSTAGKAAIAFTVLFSGNESQLRDIFPVSTARGIWRVRPAWETIPDFSTSPVSVVDSLIPPFSSLTERNTKVPKRHPSFPEGNVAIPGLRTVTPLSVRKLKVNEATLNDNFAVFGATGSGKSTLLSLIAATLIRRGRPVLIIDPHSDLVKKTLSLIPSQATDGSIIYVDAVKSPVGLNPFEIFRQIAYRDQLSSLVTESIGHVVRSAYGPEFWGPRLDFLLKGVLDAVAPLSETNYADVLELLSNPFATREVAETCPDAATKDFLLHSFPKAREEWWMPIRDKVGRIVLDAESRRILCQRRNNINLGDAITSGKSLFVDIDMSRIGETTSSLLGSMILSMYWVVACAQKCGTTVIIDEAHRFPPRLIEQIASQGRKFGVSIMVASQSPSSFSREFLGAMGSNFRNRISFQLGEVDSATAASLVGNVDKEEIEWLERMHAVANFSGNVALLDMDVVFWDKLLCDDATMLTAQTYPSVDDALPSPMASMENQLFDILQIAGMAETLGKQSLSGLQETGVFQLFPYGMQEMAALVENARSLGLIQKAHIKLSQKGWNELYRLQGGMMAGGDEHRSMVLKVKKALDTMGMLTCIPRQRPGQEQPDLLAKTVGGIISSLFYFEIEVATKYQLDKRRKKVERAERAGAIPVFVFGEKGPVLSALKKGEFPTSLFLHLVGERLMSFSRSEWSPLSEAKDIVELSRNLESDITGPTGKEL